MLLLHPRSFDYLSTYTASPMWTILVIGVIIWCVSFIIIGLRLKWLPVIAACEGPSVNPRSISISPVPISHSETQGTRVAAVARAARNVKVPAMGRE